MAQPLISVIIPTYNRAFLVARAVESVLAQAGAGLEILVVDDGSTDNTATVLSGYGNTIRVIYQDNAGAGKARNFGVQQARGDYVWFLDSDDRLAPGAAAAIREGIRHSPSADVLYGWAYGVDQAGQRTQQFRPKATGQVWTHYLYSNLTPIGSFVVRRTYATQVLFRAEMPALEDWDFLLRLSFRARFACVQAQLAELEYQPVRRSTDFEPEQILHTMRGIYANLLDDPISGPLLQPYRKYLEANSYVMLGHQYRYFLNDQAGARRAFIQAIRTAPTFWRAYTGLVQSLLDRRLVAWLRQARSRFYQMLP